MIEDRFTRMARRGDSPPASRPFNFALWLGLPAGAMTALLFIDPTSADFALARALYLPGQGFVGRQSVFLEAVLHRGVRDAMTAFMLAVLAGFIASLVRRDLAAWRRRLAYVLVAVGLSTGIVAPLKAATAVQCPWSLADFGGQESYSPLVGHRPATNNPGRCWPGGHASTGFSLLALYFALRDGHPHRARWMLGGALLLGTVLSAVRMAQGAHFLSHNVWTLLLDWTICAAAYRWMLYEPGRLVTPVRQPVARSGSADCRS
ncbi:phosphatase PAP2 family protein [Pigmentiphaga sp. NML080357]|uniref:phosphatase PAP2 family protein n=1 Tax=Pigmentiphaga sp. NML080357 TaxID=2008675 RepID=UPI0018E94949|nr:phosphatase PAP2 family protein [Pigmentiphaga sp. NML080357]